MSGRITNTYRDLEAEHDRLKAEVQNRNIQIRIESLFSGNIWENCRVLRDNINKMKAALGRQD